MKVYQIVESRESENGNKDFVHGVYQHRVAAENRIKVMVRAYISQWAYKIARMTGWKRGRNSQNFQDAIVKMANPPYRIKEIHVDSSYR